MDLTYFSTTVFSTFLSPKTKLEVCVFFISKDAPNYTVKLYR